ncbi:1,2-diacylglycerol 3-beta-galactosyltransferase [Thermoflexales bacterium]|nr:1,2-diacylglycerol 3-beta-galactosyltransferase [Thermoflexales bacterium]
MTDRPVRLLFLFADVGGGHRAPAQAVREALHRTVGQAARVELVDMLANYAPWPYNRGQETYTKTVRFARPFEQLYFRVLNGRRRMRIGASVMWRPMHRATHDLLIDHPADLVVTFHPTYSYPLTWLKVPCAFVFTDLITNHALWCAPGAERYIVPTELARAGAIDHGMPPERVHVTGLPVHPRFLDPLPAHEQICQKLGMDCRKPIILLAGGGEGLGRVYDIAYAVGQSDLDAQLVIITGRNQKLREQLEDIEWPLNTKILGFTRDMPDWMAVSSVLITKSGSNTLAEALVRGLPMILFERVGGQEQRNPQYIEYSGAGVYCPKPAKIVNTLREWLANPEQLKSLSDNARQIARPQAAFDVAKIVYDLAAELRQRQA